MTTIRFEIRKIWSFDRLRKKQLLKHNQYLTSISLLKLNWYKYTVFLRSSTSGYHGCDHIKSLRDHWNLSATDEQVVQQRLTFRYFFCDSLEEHHPFSCQPLPEWDYWYWVWHGSETSRCSSSEPSECLSENFIELGISCDMSARIEPGMFAFVVRCRHDISCLIFVNAACLYVQNCTILNKRHRNSFKSALCPISTLLLLFHISRDSHSPLYLRLKWQWQFSEHRREWIGFPMPTGKSVFASFLNIDVIKSSERPINIEGGHTRSIPFTTLLIFSLLQDSTPPVTDVSIQKHKTAGTQQVLK